jgi:hypothetical protein
MPDVINPIFVVGTGRCGSTVFHQVLSHHAHVAWLSRACVTKPHNPRANRRNIRVLDLPLPSRYLRKLIYPVEAYRFWEYYCPGFTEPCRDLLKEDVTPKVKKTVRSVMAQMLTHKRGRLLIKITGWPRIGFLKEIFPDARFIHVYRDGRAVVNSLLSVYFWSGWQGPANWRWGELTSAQKEKWEKCDRSFVALAAIEWEILMAAQEEAKRKIPSDDILEIRYEDLCQDPVKSFQMATEFSNLEWSPRFEAVIRNRSFKNTNFKWQEQLSDRQQKVLTECLEETLEKYGYA